jgi:predicted nucleotidyltransferase
MIAFSAIQAAVMRIAVQFKPQKIILFGSYAYGTPNEDSDVDYMILVRGRNVDAQETNIRMGTDFDFPVDLLVRSASECDRRIKMGDQFLIDIDTAGKVLYEAADKGVGSQSRGRLRNSGPRIACAKVSQLR